MINADYYLDLRRGPDSHGRPRGGAGHAAGLHPSPRRSARASPNSKAATITAYVLNKKEGEKGPTLAARVVDPNSGRVMEVYTTQPAMILYTANHLDGTLRGGGVAYQKHAGFCLETQHYPDSPQPPRLPLDGAPAGRNV